MVKDKKDYYIIPNDRWLKLHSSREEACPVGGEETQFYPFKFMVDGKTFIYETTHALQDGYGNIVFGKKLFSRYFEWKEKGTAVRVDKRDPGLGADLMRELEPVSTTVNGPVTGQIYHFTEEMCETEESAQRWLINLSRMDLQAVAQQYQVHSYTLLFALLAESITECFQIEEEIRGGFCATVRPFYRQAYKTIYNCTTQVHVPYGNKENWNLRQRVDDLERQLTKQLKREHLMEQFEQNTTFISRLCQLNTSRSVKESMFQRVMNQTVFQQDTFGFSDNGRVSFGKKADAHIKEVSFWPFHQNAALAFEIIGYNERETICMISQLKDTPRLAEMIRKKLEETGITSEISKKNRKKVPEFIIEELE